MSLILAKNKVDFSELQSVKTPQGTKSFTPIAHSRLVDETRTALTRAGLTVQEEEHALARDGLRYFGGFAVTGDGVNADDRRLVVGLRNSHDKSIASGICLGTSMLVCDNLCFSSNIKLARRHTTFILDDLPRVVSKAVGLATSHWSNMTDRIRAYQETEVEDLEKVVVSLVDAQALPARDIYNVVKEFRNPRHEEFKGGSLWTLYNAYTENMKGSDLSKLPTRTTVAQSIFDPLAQFEARTLDIEAEEVPA